MNIKIETVNNERANLELDKNEVKQSSNERVSEVSLLKSEKFKYLGQDLKPCKQRDTENEYLH